MESKTKQEDGKMKNRMNDYIDNVKFKKLVTEDGTPINDRRAVVDLDTGNVLGVVSPRYKIVRNSELLKAVQPAIEDLKLNPDPQISHARDGAITYFRFMGEKHQGEVRKGDIIRFGLEFFNSYDGSTPIGFHIIAMRLVCINGLVVPKSVRELHVRHSAGASAEGLRDNLVEFFPQVKNVVNLWKKWNGIEPTQTQLEEVMHGLFSNKHQEAFLENFKSLKSGDRNLWGFYNVLTHYTSHTMKSRNKGNMALKQFDIGEKMVNRIGQVFEPQLV